MSRFLSFAKHRTGEAFGYFGPLRVDGRQHGCPEPFVEPSPCCVREVELMVVVGGPTPAAGF